MKAVLGTTAADEEAAMVAEAIAFPFLYCEPYQRSVDRGEGTREERKRLQTFQMCDDEVQEGWRYRNANLDKKFEDKAGPWKG